MPLARGGARRDDVTASPQPEHIRVAPTVSKAHLHGTVASERAGAFSHGRSAARPGDRIGMAVDSAALHVFNAGSKARLT